MVLRPRVSAGFLLCLFAPLLPAQQDRIAGPIDARHSVVLRGSVPRQALARYDQGAVSADFPLGNITLMLRPSDSQQAELEQLLAEQQDPGSPNDHKWLSPEQYAERFGASAADLDKIGAWLRSEGFEVRYTARGRDFISFSGTAGQVQAALHTEIHRYRIGAETHFANARDLALPAAFEPIVAGVLGLHDFHPKAPRRRAVANYTASDGSHYVLPDDFAAIYGLTSLYGYGYGGAGQSIAIVGQSDINPDDIAAFRGSFGLAPTTIQMVPTGNYPGVTSDEVEADLDLEWAGAVARDATLIYVYSDDAGYSSYYAIDNNLAPVLSESFGLCEYQAGANRMGLSYFQVEAQKGNALGITWLASSGDSGAAGCDGNVALATQGLAVSLPASVPEITAVGGTEFAEGNGSYWNSSNGPYFGSAVSYVPETSWNDTLASGSLASSGGGLSSIYKKPSWQAGPGVPGDGVRDVPDLSLNAANGHDPYLIVSEGAAFGVGGTSAAAPAFAGILAVLDQYLVQNKVQSKPGLGNINPKLYSMAAANAPGVFHDVTTGDNIVPCQTGTPDCATGQFGFTAGTGYDLVTGLGSVDAYQLITAWSGLGVSATTTTVVASPNTILPGGSSVLTATVRAVNSTTSPTGTVSFSLGANSLGTATLSGSGGTATASMTVFGGQLTAASSAVEASYGGSPTFTASSGATELSLGTPAANSKVVLSVTPNPVHQQAPDATGATFAFTVQLRETAGVATTVTGFSFGGVSYASSIARYFGGTALPAYGTLSTTLRSGSIPAPSTQVIVFTGKDASGAAWMQQVPVQFLP
ncbi:MAG: protease pro-enzyme activation domain-containing protein [Candidatus Sulfopaludibacter sp.]|nr:protease pro-enzyme activation domain-containing protein [Candidatus Sulfopaludibacter sp.]